jgi:hypothetical protein
MHFFLDLKLKEPYKGDTTALSQETAKFDVKGESLNEERNQEKGACEEEGCSEKKEVVSQQALLRAKNIGGPEQSGPCFF